VASVLFGLEISRIASFVPLRDLINSRICWVMSIQRRSVLVGYKISMMVGFGGLQDLIDGRFWWVTRSQ